MQARNREWNKVVVMDFLLGPCSSECRACVGARVEYSAGDGLSARPPPLVSVKIVYVRDRERD